MCSTTGISAGQTSDIFYVTSLRAELGFRFCKTPRYSSEHRLHFKKQNKTKHRPEFLSELKN